MRVMVYQSPMRGEAGESALAVRSLAFGMATGPGAPTGAELAVVDAHRMSPAAIKEALALAGGQKRSGAVRRVVLLCPEPTLDMVVSAMRAGVADIVPWAPGARGLLRILRAALPADARSRAKLRALIATGRSLLRAQAARKPGAATDFSCEAAELARRREALAREEARIEGLRSALAMREAQLLRQQSRVEEALAQLQASRGEAGVDAERLENLEARERELAERARALDVREGMLREFEGLLEGASRAPFAAGSAGR